jgi:hypothetical protein
MAMAKTGKLNLNLMFSYTNYSYSQKLEDFKVPDFSQISSSGSGGLSLGEMIFRIWNQTMVGAGTGYSFTKDFRYQANVMLMQSNSESNLGIPMEMWMINFTPVSIATRVNSVQLQTSFSLMSIGSKYKSPNVPMINFSATYNNSFGG